MQVYDIIMLIVLGVAVGFGLWKGLAWQLASLASLFASYVVAFMFRDQLAAYITTDPPWNIFLAMLILYIATALGIWVVFHFVSGIIEKLKLKEFDSQLGGLFGLAKGLVLCGVITLFAITLLGNDLKQQILSSHSGYYLAVGLDKLDMVMPKELHDVVGPYLHPISEQVGNHPHGHAAAEPKSLLPSLPTLAIPKDLIPAFPKATPAQPAPVQPAAPLPAPPVANVAAQKPEQPAVQPPTVVAPASSPPTQPPVTVAAQPRPLPPPGPAAPPTAPVQPRPVAPASWPASAGNYDPYSGPPAALGQGDRR